MRLTWPQRAALIAGILLAGLMWGGKAEAHSWFSRTGCCGGSDCAAVPIDADWVQLGKNGYYVRLTVAQARMVNPDAEYPVDELVPWHSNKIKSLPALRPGETYGAPALYYLCIPAKYSGIYCLFPVPGL